MPRITILGAGNVAWAMGKRLFKKKCDIHQIYSRTPQAGRTLATSLDANFCNSLQDIDPEVEIIIVAISDDAIAQVAKQIPNTSAMVIHCSGSTPLAALPQKNRAVIWPLRSIATGQSITWKDMNMVVEADTDHASVRAMDLIQLLGSKPVQMDSEKRKTAHLVAVILNNFSNHLLHIADVLCEEQGMERRIFQDLMSHSLEYSGPALTSQTGPAARDDEKVMERQLEMLKEHPQFQAVYQAISASIMKENDGQEL